MLGALLGVMRGPKEQNLLLLPMLIYIHSYNHWSNSPAQNRVS